MLSRAAHPLLLTILICASLPAFALEDTPQNRAEQADRYLVAVSPQSMMADMSAKMAETLPPAQQEEFKTLMSKYLDMTRVTTSIRAAMIKTFTSDELQALADFYGSAVGKSAMAKMGEYMSEVMPATMSEIQTALAKAQEEAAQKK